ncbi:MAG: glycosyltransferase [Candidatus Competibacteraceae bacterium]|jgi:teichuronic acid biosynthesis glycosyltransferase TuaG|nr:glycosyltransferase [Candidatus Competibacteraceae bacterium]
MKNPLISIITPCYNAERYVGEAIESAPGQTYPNIEMYLTTCGYGLLNSLRMIRRH